MTLFGIELPMSTITIGALSGFIYGVLGVGMVIIYRTNRIINFSQGEIGAAGAAVFLLAVRNGGVPYYVTLPLALAAGAGVAAFVEVLVIRRLRVAPRLMSLIATLLVAQLIVGFVALTGVQRGSPEYPGPPGLPQLQVGTLIVSPADTGKLLLTPVVIIGLALFLRKSRFGLALRGASANPEAARMAGVFASRMSTLAWAMSGALSTFSAILVAPTLPGGLTSGTSFGPTILLRGLVGAVIARMTNLPLAMAGGIGLGIVEALLLRNFQSGALTEVTLFVAIVVALLVQARQGTREGDKGSAWATIQPWRPLPEALQDLWSIRNLGIVFGLVVLAGLVFIPMGMSILVAITLTSLLGFAMMTLSVGLITGLGGQLTLGQFALGAVGATVSYHIATRTGGNVPLGLLYGGLAAAAVTLIIGLPALRIRGLFLAVTTLSFAAAVSTWVLQQPWALGDGVDPGQPVLFGRTLDPRLGREYYYFALVVFVVLLITTRNLRRRGFGRLLVAVRDNEDAARAFGIHARRIKIQGFLIAGFIAGVAGAAYGHSFSSIGPRTFLLSHSIDVVIMSVIGGIGVLAGPLLGVVFREGLPAFVPIRAIGIFATNLGALLLIMYFPGGILQLVAPLRNKVIHWLARRKGITEDVIAEREGDQTEVLTRPAIVTTELSPNGRASLQIEQRNEILRAVDVRKSYGGLVAVNDVSLTVIEGETVGLIGPNGAGKTTLFEMLAGFIPIDHGRVLYYGEDVSRWSPETRAESGLIRSFQDVSLFPTLSVLDTVQLALERRIPTRLSTAVLGLAGRDRKREELARDLVGSMGLWSFRNKQIQELSTGTRRITELACLVALRPKLLLLDEPSSGIAQRETEALGGLLMDLKKMYSMTLVIIEHDIPLIMGLSDRIIAMDTGNVIAHGSPEEIRSNEAVIEAYLGGRLEAIERSGLLSEVVGDGSSEEDALRAIPGLGQARIEALVEAFGTVDAIRAANRDDIARVKGISSSLASRILQDLSQQESERV
jgi:ABC-type branched-subunit amino acid transport system ATPase component/ABC-type branched-subunit amino acid transport system permease subunit